MVEIYGTDIVPTDLKTLAIMPVSSIGTDGEAYIACDQDLRGIKRGLDKRFGIRARFLKASGNKATLSYGT